MKSARCLIVFIVLASLLSGCGQHRVRPGDEVDVALYRYRHLIQQGDFDRVAGMFESNAELSHDELAPIVGRDSIRTFLNSFKDYKIIEYELVVMSTSQSGAAATQLGRYHQKVISPAGAPIEVRGSFSAEWARDADGSWLLHRMHTSSGAAAPRDQR